MFAKFLVAAPMLLLVLLRAVSCQAHTTTGAKLDLVLFAATGTPVGQLFHALGEQKFSRKIFETLQLVISFQ